MCSGECTVHHEPTRVGPDYGPAGSAAEQRNSRLDLLIDTRYLTLKGRTQRSRLKGKVES